MFPPDGRVTQTEAAVLLDWLPAIVERMNDTEDERSAWFRSRYVRPDGSPGAVLDALHAVVATWFEGGGDE